MGDVIGDLNSRRGMVNKFDDKPGGMKLVQAYVPLAEMFNYVSTLRGMTKGRANYRCVLCQRRRRENIMVVVLVVERDSLHSLTHQKQQQQQLARWLCVPLLQPLSPSQPLVEVSLAPLYRLPVCLSHSMTLERYEVVPPNIQTEIINKNKVAA